jgi:hypothetical protein
LGFSTSNFQAGGNLYVGGHDIYGTTVGGSPGVVRLVSALGSSSLDEVVTVASTLTASSINASAKLLSIKTGYGTNEQEQFGFYSNGRLLGSSSITFAGQNGTGSGDISTKAGTTLADGTIDGSAKLFSVRTGIGGSETEYLNVTKTQISASKFVGDGSGLINITGGGTTTNNYSISPSGIYDKNVSLMLNFSGANNSTNIFDNSYNRKTVTPYGDAKISTAQSKYGGSSLYLDGNGDYLSIPSSEDLNFGTSDFTIEFWAYCTDNTNNYPTYISTYGGWGLGAFGYRFDNTGQAGKFSIHWNPDDPILTTTNTFSFNQWRHTALVRNGTALTLYVNGNQESTTTISPSRTLDLGLSGSMLIGWSRWDGSNGYLNDYMDDLRITKGVARYTGSFTPPTQELSAELPLQSSYTGSLNVTGNLNISGAINLVPQSTLPTGNLGKLAVSGSSLYFHDGSSWRQVSLV